MKISYQYHDNKKKKFQLEEKINDMLSFCAMMISQFPLNERILNRTLKFGLIVILISECATSSHNSF